MYRERKRREIKRERSIPANMHIKAVYIPCKDVRSFPDAKEIPEDFSFASGKINSLLMENSWNFIGIFFKKKLSLL